MGKASIGAVTDSIGKTQADAIDFARHFNLAWVELRNLPESGKEFALMTGPELKRTAAELLSNKLKVSFLNTTLLKFDWSADQKRWDRRKDDLANALLAANILGVDKIGIFTGTRGPNPSAAYMAIARTIEEFIPLAEQAKVRLAISNDASQNIASSAEARDLLALVPSKTVGLNWDPAAARKTGETPFPDGYGLLPKTRLMNIHFHAGDVAEGADKLPWKSMLEALQKDNYDLRIGFEGAPGDASDAVDEMMHLAGRLE
jgi:sugar phosphate isomerase/epimerase